MTYAFWTDGDLPAGSPFYIQRQADAQAWDALRRAEYIVLMGPPDQGKTSLINQLRHRSETAGYSFAYVDLMPLCEVSDEAGWYGSLCQTLLRKLDMSGGEQAPLEATSGATWYDFLGSVAEMADRNKRRLVIAFDEIGAIPRDRANGFFSAIRSIYSHHRERLTIVLSGAIDIREMITDPNVSPFNIATRITLRDFSLEEVQSLVGHLDAVAANSELAKYIHDQTGGQPYLCQRLCQYLSEDVDKADTRAVDAAIERFFREDMIHLPAILRGLEVKPDLVKYLCRALVEKPRFSPATNQNHFQLAHVIGIIAADQPVCQVRNPIYQRALDEAGLCSELPSEESKRGTETQKDSPTRQEPRVVPPAPSLPAIDALPLESRPAWQALKAHYAEYQGSPPPRLVRQGNTTSTGSGERMTCKMDGLYLDYSKNRITDETIRLLIELANECGLRQWIDAMFAGAKINTTENRAALHVALRAPRNTHFYEDGEDVVPQVHAVLDSMADFANRVRAGEWKGYTGKPIRNVVNIGIGGSDLGPAMAFEALRSYADHSMQFRFVSNVAGADFLEAVKGLAPEETLFIVASKTFTTLETMTNADTARTWLLNGWKTTSEPSPGILWRSRPAMIVLIASASIRPTCSASGTGWAAATRCVRPSACPL